MVFKMGLKVKIWTTGKISFSRLIFGILWRKWENRHFMPETSYNDVKRNFLNKISNFSSVGMRGRY
jgi:hypothetical protein